MARNAARLKMGFYPLPESEAVRLRALLEFTGPASVVDPCVGQGTALEIVTQGADVHRYGVELDAERALIAQSKGIETIQGNAFDAIAKPESFSLLYLNPPYDSEIGLVENNRMERLFLDHTYRWLAMDGDHTVRPRLSDRGSAQRRRPEKGARRLRGQAAQGSSCL